MSLSDASCGGLCLRAHWDIPLVPVPQAGNTRVGELGLPWLSAGGDQGEECPALPGTKRHSLDPEPRPASERHFNARDKIIQLTQRISIPKPFRFT